MKTHFSKEKFRQKKKQKLKWANSKSGRANRK